MTDHGPFRFAEPLRELLLRGDAVRDYLVLYINGERHEVRGEAAFLPLSEYLRERLRLTGTKVVCSEGDCGACSVLTGRPEDGRLRYCAADSCILFLYQLDRTHVVTVEGLARNGELNAVQEAMVRCFGSQCGFCTPGFVVAMTGLFETGNGRRRTPLSDEELRRGLSGNLCRCTGYVQIMEAGRSIDPAAMRPMAEHYAEGAMVEEFEALAGTSIQLSATIMGRERTMFLPATLEEAVAFKASHPEAVTVAGATDVGVQRNKGRIDPEAVLSLVALRELEAVEVVDGVLRMGARASWSRVEEVVRDLVPEYYRILVRFGGPQIRNWGVVGGNIMNASPIADSAPFHFVTNTELELAGPEGTRRVNINDFYLGYKKMDVRPGELLVRIDTPLPKEDEILRLYKVSRRRDLDISTFTAGMLMRRSGDTVEDIRIAFGGVAPVVLRLPQAEEFLRGAPIDEETFRQAGYIARGEISPISDVRGSADFRLQLAENILVRFFHDCQEPAPEKEAMPCPS